MYTIPSIPGIQYVSTDTSKVGRGDVISPYVTSAFARKMLQVEQGTNSGTASFHQRAPALPQTIPPTFHNAILNTPERTTIYNTPQKQNNFSSKYDSTLIKYAHIGYATNSAVLTPVYTLIGYIPLYTGQSASSQKIAFLPYGTPVLRYNTLYKQHAKQGAFMFPGSDFDLSNRPRCIHQARERRSRRKPPHSAATL